MSDQKTDSYSVEKKRPLRQVPAAPLRIRPKSLIEIIWNNLWIVIITTGIAGAGAFLYISNIIPVYTSTASIYVEQSGPKILTETAEGVMTQSNNYLYTQAQLIKSTPILADVADKLKNNQIKTFEETNNVIDYLQNSLTTNVGQQDNIIRISIDTPYPEESAQIVNQVVDSYISYQAKQKRNTAAEVLKILRNEKEERGKELMDKLEKMTDFKKENYELGFEDTQGNIIIERLRTLSSVLTQAQLKTIEAKAAYDYTREMVSDPNKLRQFKEAIVTQNTSASADSEISSLNSTLKELESRLADRLRQVNSNHPAVISIENEIANTKKHLNELDDEFVKTQLSVTELQYLNAQQQEEQIANHYEEQRQLALTLNNKLAQYVLLQSDYEQTKKNCDILDDRIKELNVTEDAGVLNIITVEKARVAEKPSDSQNLRFVAIALMIGILAGGGLAFLRDISDNKMHSAEEISAFLNLPVVSSVPSIRGRRNISARGQKVQLDPDSRAAEAYRMIRTAVFFNTFNNKAKTILVTSPGTLEGKSTLASNLAISMAQVGKKILLLDADLRNPTQAGIFGINSERGLISLLSGTTNIDNAITSTEIDGLYLLACETPLINPSEILNSDGFVKILEYLSSKYDHIIIDSPPLIPVTDAQILAAICDLTLLTIRAEITTRKMSIQANERLLSVGANILGVVINDVSKKNHYSYQSTFGNYYSRSKRTNFAVKKQKETSVKIKSPAGPDN